ncbi:hypothetical protein CC78DRAFT_530489 [Lojkania enalia]|uniref:DUF7626 domain-containing protein n=1 Tax=Lojkania enalia TaxID=147567 RepID=A0A9P4N843_9PLEO|nr:hypothetical protein CC78DRAFT_530489 [Didymosphaeria enalia]
MADTPASAQKNPPAVDDINNDDYADEDMNDSALGGIKKVHSADDDEDDDDMADDEDGTSGFNGEGMNLTTTPRKSQPAFFERSTKAAERAAQRSTFDENNSFLLLDNPGLNVRTPSRVPGCFGKRDRGKGGAPPAYAKRVTADLDSDDELMMNLKDSGFSDQQIADQLADEGRVRYDRKSICTRIFRIREKQAKLMDDMLEQGLVEWQYPDDSLLIQAHELAEAEISTEIERIRSQRFRKVSEHMRKLNKDAKWSAKACHDRYTALMDGTAKIPSQQHDDPEARRRELEARRAAFERARLEERQVQEEKATRAQKIKEEARLRSAQKAEQTALAREQKQKDKAERAMKRAAQQQLKAERAVANRVAKNSRHEHLKAKKVAELEDEENYSKAHVNESGISVVDPKKPVPGEKDPRSHLSLEDLKRLCAHRGVNSEGKSREELTGLLQCVDEAFSLNQLKAMCRAKGLNTAGTKAQQQQQLALAEARSYASYVKGFEREQPIEGGKVKSTTELIDLGSGDEDEDEAMLY